MPRLRIAGPPNIIETMDPGPPLPPALRSGLERIYRELDDEVRALGVGCWIRGDCCDFDRSEHRLFASTLEIAFVREKRGGGHAPGNAAPGSALCPFWESRRCTERERRPLGCRTFFCDPRYREPLEALYEKHYRRIRELAEEAGFAWAYTEFVPALRAPGGAAPAP